MLFKNIYRFCTQRKYHFQDVLKLQHLNQQQGMKLQKSIKNFEGERKNYFFISNQVVYFYFHSKKVFIKTEGTVLEMQQAIKKQIADVSCVGIYTQSNNQEMIEYASSTPLGLVIQDDFVIKLNQNENYVILSKVDDPPVIDLIDNYQITQHPLHQYFQNIDVPQRTKVVLLNFIQKLIAEVEKNQSQHFNKDLIQLIIKKVILKLGIYAQTQKQLIDNQIDFLESKSVKLQNLKEKIINELENKEQQTLYQIYFYILMQIAFTQYGTYVVWGWDVMEPVTFMLGVIDMIIAYQFWMKTTKAYTFSNVLQNAVNKHLDKKLEEAFNYSEELNDVNKMIEYLKFKQMIFSSNIYDVINVIEGAIEEKQAKLQAQEDDD